MPITSYGHEHRKFAWWPRNTDDHGWVWLRRIYRRRCHLDLFGAPTFWVYTVHPQSRSDR